MTLDEMLMALEYGPIHYGQDDDYILVPVQTANKIAATIRRLEKVAAEMREELAYDTEDLGKTLTNGMLAYDKLMKGDDK